MTADMVLGPDSRTATRKLLSAPAECRPIRMLGCSNGHLRCQLDGTTLEVRMFRKRAPGVGAAGTAPGEFEAHEQRAGEIDLDALPVRAGKILQAAAVPSIGCPSQQITASPPGILAADRSTIRSVKETILTCLPISLCTAFRQLPYGQLVILGEAGGGKSILAMLLTLQLLNRDTRTRLGWPAWALRATEIVFLIAAWT